MQVTSVARAIAWLLLPIAAAAASWQLQQRLASDPQDAGHGHGTEPEEFEAVGMQWVIARGLGWETRKYETRGGHVCLDTWFEERVASGGCYDLSEGDLQWNLAGHDGTYILTGWAPSECKRVVAEGFIIHVADPDGLFWKQVDHRIRQVECR
jgi:hypothetical protein